MTNNTFESENIVEVQGYWFDLRDVYSIGPETYVCLPHEKTPDSTVLFEVFLKYGVQFTLTNRETREDLVKLWSENRSGG